jgi:hypothetical protein
MLPLIHCGCGLGQAAIADIGEIAKRSATPDMRLRGAAGDVQMLGPSAHSPPAWRLGPAAAPNRKFQTGWGRNFTFGAPQFILATRGATSSPA